MTKSVGLPRPRQVDEPGFSRSHVTHVTRTGWTSDGMWCHCRNTISRLHGRIGRWNYSCLMLFSQLFSQSHPVDFLSNVRFWFSPAGLAGVLTRYIIQTYDFLPFTNGIFLPITDDSPIECDQCSPMSICSLLHYIPTNLHDLSLGYRTQPITDPWFVRSPTPWRWQRLAAHSLGAAMGIFHGIFIGL